MAMENKRIIQLNTERTTPAADDYVMVDSATAGTAKYLLPKITDAINQENSDRASADTALQTAITNEATARTNADTTLQGNITAEATARAEADTAINGEITQLKEDTTQLKNTLSDIFEYSESATAVENIAGITKRDGWNATAGTLAVIMTTLESYDSYWFVTDKDIDIWVDANNLPYYFAIVVGNGAFTSAVEESSSMFLIYCDGGSTRYRTSDNNLPTAENKLHIANGVPVAFTVPHTYSAQIYGVGEKDKVVKESFKTEVVRRNWLRYVGASGADASTERVEIYLPSGDGYIRYDLLHTVNSEINANVWRIGYAYYTDGDFGTVYPITTQGEWECAISLYGRPDFSGGNAHGDEIQSSIVFIVDGAIVNISSLTEMTAFDDLTIVRISNLYDPNDSTTIYAEHGVKYNFADKLTIRQTVKFIIEESVKMAYLAMFPIAKAVSNVVLPYSELAPLSTDSAIRLTGTKGVTIYRTDGKVKADFEVDDFDFLDDGYTFICIDNGGQNYNKCYFANCTSNTVVTSGEIIKAESIYNIAATE